MQRRLQIIALVVVGGFVLTAPRSARCQPAVVDGTTVASKVEDGGRWQFKVTKTGESCPPLDDPATDGATVELWFVPAPFGPKVRQIDEPTGKIDVTGFAADIEPGSCYKVWIGFRDATAFNDSIIATKVAAELREAAAPLLSHPPHAPTFELDPWFVGLLDWEFFTHEGTIPDTADRSAFIQRFALDVSFFPAWPLSVLRPTVGGEVSARVTSQLVSPYVNGYSEAAIDAGLALVLGPVVVAARYGVGDRGNSQALAYIPLAGPFQRWEFQLDFVAKDSAGAAVIGANLRVDEVSGQQEWSLRFHFCGMAPFQNGGLGGGLVLGYDQFGRGWSSFLLGATFASSVGANVGS
jgi:hypothetical protein